MEKQIQNVNSNEFSFHLVALPLYGIIFINLICKHEKMNQKFTHRWNKNQNHKLHRSE